jgi:hypothetical protein
MDNFAASAAPFLKKTYGVGYQLTIEKQQVPGQDSTANNTKLEVIVKAMYQRLLS